MSLALEVLAECFDGVLRGEEALELGLLSSGLFLLVGGQDLQIVLCQVLDALQERRNRELVFDLELFRRCLVPDFVWRCKAFLLVVRGAQVQHLWS